MTINPNDGGWVSEHDDPKSTQMAAAMMAAGQKPFEAVAVDYFAMDEDVRTTLPDGVQWISHRVLNEGDRKKYLKVVQRDLKIQKGTQDMIMKLAAGEDRTALVEVAVTGWNLVRGGQPWPFTPANLREFANNGPIKVLDILERDIKKNNPWLLGDMTVEDIDEELDRLHELRREVEAQQSGKPGSAN